MKGQPQKRITVAQIEEALKKKAGNISQAAKDLGVDRNTIYAHIKSSPTLQTVLQNSREELVDIAESALLRNIIEGKESSIFYALNNSLAAKSRGWGPRHEITGVNGGAIEQVVKIDFSNLSDEQLDKLLETANSLKGT